jgi:acyl carrier protein
MAAGLNSAERPGAASLGLEPLEPATALDLMSALLQRDLAQAAVLQVDWDRYLRQTQSAGTASYLEELLLSAGSEPSGSQGELIRQLKRSPTRKQFSLLVRHVQGLVGQLLGAESPESVRLDRGFFDLGMDSLAVTMLRNQLQDGLGLPLPATLTFQYSTVDTLCDYLAECVLGIDTSPRAVGAERRDPEQPKSGAGLAADLESLSEAELADRLAKKLAAIRAGNGKT